MTVSVAHFVSGIHTYEKDGETVYTTDLVTTEFLLLAKHQPKDADDSLVDDEA